VILNRFLLIFELCKRWSDGRSFFCKDLQTV
jgi:hypothetical protein